MSEKVTIPAEVADLIGNMRGAGYTSEEISRVAMGNTSVPYYHEVLTKITFDTLLAALVNGYEREMTEEEEERVARAHAAIRKLYVRHALGSDGYEATLLSKAHAEGVKFTLDTLGIQIEGVNA